MAAGWQALGVEVPSLPESGGGLRLDQKTWQTYPRQCPIQNMAFPAGGLAALEELTQGPWPNPEVGDAEEEASE